MAKDYKEAFSVEEAYNLNICCDPLLHDIWSQYGRMSSTLQSPET
jgi:hypothetical protein